MATHTISNAQKSAAIPRTRWLKIGLQAALGSVLVVLLSQAAILALRPELSAFKPLDSYVRSAIFTFIPAVVATGVFAWLAKNKNQPEKKFIWVSVAVLLLSFIPDYLLPVPNRTLMASTAAAFLHLVAGAVTVSLILAGYARSSRAGGTK